MYLLDNQEREIGLRAHARENQFELSNGCLSYAQEQCQRIQERALEKKTFSVSDKLLFRNFSPSSS